jgi:V-type H+-transporting ATPase subunit H
VAIHDCGEYVRHYPYGQKALDEIGGKRLIMAHMEHSAATVRYEALLAVQKLMTDHWCGAVCVLGGGAA